MNKNRLFGFGIHNIKKLSNCPCVYRFDVHNVLIRMKKRGGWQPVFLECDICNVIIPMKKMGGQQPQCSVVERPGILK